MPAGRPSKYKPDYCEEAVKLGKLGKSPAQIAAHFDVARQTIDNWAADHPEFLDALTRAKTHEQAWWEEAAQTGKGQEIGPAIWGKSVAARFRDDYTERKEVTGKDGEPLMPDTQTSDRELAKAVVSILRRATTEGPSGNE